ncbi:cytochrome b/b6 domain-containing protein, partial [Providencia rettgeri]|nr:cytochrome b/b6 domain-containing protein [Providencia rettgeri]EJD6601202.1 cytochrome b/b6 domain-containing protein [Providencia rettgeri]
DFKQIKEDINSLLAKKLPDSSPKGLAATVQGLGLGALSIVILSGIAWFILWLQQSPFALEARSIHKSLTILIEIYIYGHGGLGIIHFIIWNKSKNK